MIWPNSATLAPLGSFLWDSLQRGLSRGEVAAFSTCCQNLSEPPAGLPRIEPELDFIATFRTYHFTLSVSFSALLIKGQFEKC